MKRSIGKDSTVLLWLARKAFLGRVPFPLIHIDTTFKIPEMLTWRVFRSIVNSDSGHREHRFRSTREHSAHC